MPGKMDEVQLVAIMAALIYGAEWRRGTVDVALADLSVESAICVLRRAALDAEEMKKNGKGLAG